MHPESNLNAITLNELDSMQRLFPQCCLHLAHGDYDTCADVKKSKKTAFRVFQPFVSTMIRVQ